MNYHYLWSAYNSEFFLLKMKVQVWYSIIPVWEYCLSHSTTICKGLHRIYIGTDTKVPQRKLTYD